MGDSLSGVSGLSAWGLRISGSCLPRQRPPLCPDGARVIFLPLWPSPCSPGCWNTLPWTLGPWSYLQLSWSAEASFCGGLFL